MSVWTMEDYAQKMAFLTWDNGPKTKSVKTNNAITPFFCAESCLHLIIWCLFFRDQYGHITMVYKRKGDQYDGRMASDIVFRSCYGHGALVPAYVEAS